MTNVGTSPKSIDQCRPILDSLPVPLIVSQNDTKKVVWANQHASDLFGYTLSEFNRLTVGDLTHPDFRPELSANYALSSNKSGLVTFKQYLRKDGTAFLAELRAAPCGVDPTLVFAFIINVEQSDGLRLDLVRSAATDALTGLLRRDAFTSAAAVSVSSGQPYGIVFLDLDNFKEVNDLYGHAAGDDVLQAVGTRIKETFRDRDLICRIGGDEFVVFIHRLARSVVLRRIINDLSLKVERPIDLTEVTLTPRASIGGVLAEPGCELDTAIHQADQAMYRAKHRNAAGGETRRSELVRLSSSGGSAVEPL